VTGTGDSETLSGTLGGDQITALGGDDILLGGAGADVLDGGAGWDSASYVTSAIGVTVNLAAASENTGEAFGDTYISIEALIGSDFGDILVGDEGANGLHGGAGNDLLTGGAGSDTFVFGIGGGQDTIGDFAAGASSEDFIRFEGLFASFAEVVAAASQSGRDTIIDIDANTRLTLNNVSVTGLHQDDFQFA